VAFRSVLRAIFRATCLAAVLSCGDTSTNGADSLTGPSSLAPVLTTLVVTLTPSSIASGATATASVAGLDQSGFPITVGTVVWSSTVPAIATVSIAGVVTGVSNGSAQIVATVGTLQARTTIGVAQAAPVLTSISVSLAANPITVGQLTKANFSGLDQFGAAYPIGVINWSSSSAGIATVNPIGGVSGVGAGQTQIIASAGGITGQTALTVLPIPVATLTLTPQTASVAVGLTSQFAVTAIDANGSLIASPTIVWTSSDTTKAKVSSAGLVSGIAVGRVTITAQSGGKSSVATVTIASDVVQIGLSPANATIVVAQTTHATASIAIVNGVSTAVTFSSSNPAVATVTGVGAVATITGVSPGTANIIATSVADTTKSATLHLMVDLYALSFTVQPTNSAAGVAIAPAMTVSIRDGLGALVAGATNAITLSISTNPGNSAIGGTTTVAAVGGVATFSTAFLTKVGTGYVLQAASPGLENGLSGTFNITFGAATQLAFGVGPATNFVGTSIAPAMTVLVEDAFGNFVTNAVTSVNMAIGTNPGGATMGGTTPVAAVAGTATFSDITISAIGSGYTLVASAAGLTSATSPSFTVAGFLTLGTGFSESCGVTTAALTYCWGNNAGGALGGGSGIDSSATPVLVLGGHVFSTVGVGNSFACGATTGSAAYCWGTGTSGQLGNGSTGNSSVPVAVSGGILFSSVTGPCGRATSGAAWCWGDNSSGRLGNGTNTNSSVPVPVSGGHNFAQVAAGSNAHACGVDTSNAAWCWGADGSGQLGDGATTDSNVPVAVIGGHLFAQVSAGSGGQSCGVTTAHAAYCWGSNANGLLGNGGGLGSSTPVLVSGGILFTQVSSGTSSNCGVDTGGNAWCWGDGVAGELGNGASGPSNVPVLVAGGLQFAFVSAGGSNNCGSTTGGAVFCWGLGSSGQLGNGGTANSNVPVRVSTPP
jgi:alpha-tubulin suppressor-like RCC1 family protein/uncharacterized protein YjdB